MGDFPFTNALLEGVFWNNKDDSLYVLACSDIVHDEPTHHERSRVAPRVS